MTAPVIYALTASMSRPRQMHILARALTDRYEVAFAAVYNESRRDWQMDWCNGPTEDEVRGALSRLAAGLPAVTSLRLYRASTGLAEAVSLLMWIDADPTRLTGATGYWITRDAIGATRYPERAPEAWTRRAQRLLDTHPPTGSRLEWLAAHTWAQVLAALDIPA